MDTKNLKFTTKDSGKRYTEESGFQRDTQAGKPRFWLLYPKGIPYADQPLTRVAELLSRGAEKYDSRNWEQADSETALERAKESAMRHLTQACCGEEDEDHFAAVVFNCIFAMTLEYKRRCVHEKG